MYLKLVRSFQQYSASMRMSLYVLKSQKNRKLCKCYLGCTQIRQSLAHNNTKAGVDTMDQVLGRHTTQRQTNRWPLAFFFTMFLILQNIQVMRHYSTKLAIERIYGKPVNVQNNAA